ncbi:MAG: putative S-adenosylmethionine-dependent methyltransferase [Bradyrhizobium sp.]|nr:putative S-adenosylmethionine-dependent methyltransferase [Bradyrhizobium sp.]
MLLQTNPSAVSTTPSTFETELPSCPFDRCDMRSNHDVVGRGWDFEYHSTHKEIDYLQCSACQLIFPRDIPAESALPIIYPPHYYAFSETDTANPIVMRIRGWMARAKGRVYMTMVPSPVAAVIDIGCGDGRLLDILRLACPSGWQLHGIDWSEQAVERLRGRGYIARNGDISRLDLSDWQGKFDLAVMHQLIEHVRDPRDILEKIGSILKPGGVLSIETPDIDCWDFHLLRKRYWSVYHIPRHFYIFNKSNFTELARMTGFEVISTKSLVNPVAWIHSLKSFCADHRPLRRFARYFHHQNVLLLALFTPLEILQTRFAGTSSNMQINLRKL